MEGQENVTNLNQAVTGVSTEKEARALLLSAGIASVQSRAAFVPSTTDKMPCDVWTPPMPIADWLDDFPSQVEIDAYRDGLLHHCRYQTAFHVWFIRDGLIMKTKGAIIFLRPDNHEMIELPNLEAIAAWLAFKKAKIWQAPERK